MGTSRPLKLGLKGRALVVAVVIAASVLTAAIWLTSQLEFWKSSEIATINEQSELIHTGFNVVREFVRESGKPPQDTLDEEARAERLKDTLDRVKRRQESILRTADIGAAFGPEAYRTGLVRSKKRFTKLSDAFTTSASEMLASPQQDWPALSSGLIAQQVELVEAAMALETDLHRLSLARLGQLQVISQIAYSTVFGLVFVLCALCSLPVAARMKELLESTRRDKESLQTAFDELVRTKEELDSQTVELSTALEEAQGQTALFEHASNRFQQLFGGLPVGCLTYDLGGTIQEWNQAMSDLVKVEGHFVVFQHFSFVFQEYEGSPAIFEIIQSVLEQGSKREFEWKHRLRDGSDLYVLYATYPLRNIRGEILGGILAGVDITARREAQVALETSEERLGLALNAASTGIFDWRIDEGTQYWSPKVYEILGAADSAQVPDPYEILNRTHEDDRAAFQKAVEAHLEGLTDQLDIEARVRCDHGGFIWVQIKGEAVRDYSGNAFRMTGSIEDISERKRVQLELAQSESRFRDVTDAAGEIVFEVNESGEITFLTDRFSEIMGRPASEFLGRTFHSCLPKQSHRTAGLQYRRLVKQKKKISEAVLRCELSNGAECVLSISAIPHWSADGRFLGYRGTAMDITRQKHAEEELAFANLMLHDTLESIGDSFFSIDKAWQISYANSPAASSMGATADQLIGQKLYDVIPPEVFNTVSANASEAMERLRERTFEIWNPASRQWLLYRIYPRQDGASIFSQDITERKSFEAQIESQMLEINEKNVILQLQQANLEEANRRLEALASTDGLTGLKNHKAFQASLKELHAEAEDMEVPLSVILLDVDHFKNYNDSFGHPAGDEVLRSVATILKQQGRRGDITARYGGEEFIVILPNTPAREALKAAERIRRAIESHPWQVGAITASLGVAESQPGLTRQNLISRADSALYSAKRAGRNKCLLWQEGSGSETHAA